MSGGREAEAAGQLGSGPKGHPTWSAVRPQWSCTANRSLAPCAGRARRRSSTGQQAKDHHHSLNGCAARAYCLALVAAKYVNGRCICRMAAAVWDEIEQSSSESRLKGNGTLVGIPGAIPGQHGTTRAGPAGQGAAWAPRAPAVQGRPGTAYHRPRQAGRLSPVVRICRDCSLRQRNQEHPKRPCRGREFTLRT